MPHCPTAIRSKDRNIRRAYCPIGRIRSWASAVFVVHWIASQRLIQATGAAKHLLLRSGTAEEAAASLNTIRKVQRKRLQSAFDESSRRSESCFVRDLNARLRVC